MYVLINGVGVGVGPHCECGCVGVPSLHGSAPPCSLPNVSLKSYRPVVVQPYACWIAYSTAIRTKNDGTASATYGLALCIDVGSGLSNEKTRKGQPG